MAPAAPDDRHVEHRVSYLTSMHTVYTEHINNMMSFFLVAGGLILNAVVQSRDPEFYVNNMLQSGIGFMGMVVSFIFLGIHFRSQQLLHALENSMRDLERVIFDGRGGFLLNQPASPLILRMRFLFPAAYLCFAAVFLVAAIVPLVWHGV